MSTGCKPAENRDMHDSDQAESSLISEQRAIKPERCDIAKHYRHKQRSYLFEFGLQIGGPSPEGL